tara:strand:+ start:145 stop:510 length:366 start_codon:yes stop_codon:yes gene_type:complete
MGKYKLKLTSMALTLGMLLVGIGGCSTGTMGETVIGDAGSPYWFDSASIETQVAFYKKRCGAYGIKDDTAEMTQCIRTTLEEEKAAATSRELEALRTMGGSKAKSSMTCNTSGNTTTCEED